MVLAIFFLPEAYLNRYTDLNSVLPDVGLGAREVLLDGPKNVFSIVASLQVVVVCLTMVVGFVGVAALVDVSAAALLVVVALFVVSPVLNSVLPHVGLGACEALLD